MAANSSRILLDVFDTGEYTQSGGMMTEFSAAFGGHTLTSSEVPVAFQPRQHRSISGLLCADLYIRKGKGIYDCAEKVTVSEGLATVLSGLGQPPFHNVRFRGLAGHRIVSATASA